jgi:hypothetical protein
MKRFFGFLSAVVLTSGLAMGQATSGVLVGTVKDATGAAVPNVSVTVVNEATGVATKTVAGGTGEFRVQNLLPGAYDVKVSGAGFAPSTLKGVAVTLNSTATANVSLALGSQSTTVEVSADSAALLDTVSQNLTTAFSNEELSNLPTAAIGGAGQSGVLNMSLLSPGVASSGGLGIGVGPSVGGQRPRNNNFEIEGVDNNNKAVTGPLVYLPNDAVGSFTLITNQFSPEFGHSSGGQFNTTVLSGGQFGGPIIKDKLFFFVNYERNTIGQNDTYYLCTPTAAGLTQLNSLSGTYGFSANNLTEYSKYVPAANYAGGAQVTAANDNACFNQAPSTANGNPAQTLTVTNGGSTSTQIPLGNYLVSSPYFTNYDAVTASADYTISNKDSIRVRYIYNTEATTDFAAALPTFWIPQPFKYYLATGSEFHSFTSNLINEFRIGFNRYTNTLPAGNFTFPGLDVFPNLQFYDQGFISIGPDGNAPQSTIQNLYQVTDNVSYTKGQHTLKFGFDGRKYISPQVFTQRARGDYEWANLDQYLHDLAPDQNGFAERSTGNSTYYGDQTALYGYVNDTWRATPKLTINAGLRYEFTSVPVGEREQSLNSVSSVPGLINFHAPQPSYTSFAPRVGINFAPDEKTTIRAGFGIAYDVLFDNLGTLSFPPQLSQTQDVGSGSAPGFSSPNFLKDGGLPPGTGSGVTVLTAAQARPLTSAFLPDQVLPYAETYTLTVQHSFGGDYTAEVGYTGTRGIHLPTQIQLNVQPRVNSANQVPTFANGTLQLTSGGASTTTVGAIDALSNILPQFAAQNFTSKITSYQPYSGSNYNGLVANLTKRLHHGLQMNLSYTYSKTMDNATDEVFATVLTPRRPENSQNLQQDYSRSALDRTNRISFEVLYDLPYYKNSSNFIKKNIIGNWTISPIYTYESPEYATALSGVNSNLNGDSGAAIDRPIINPNGVKGTGTGSVAIVNPALVTACTGLTAATTVNTATAANGAFAACDADTVGYSAGSLNGTGAFVPSNAYYVQAGDGTLPNAARNTLPVRPIDNIDVALYKRITVLEKYSIEFGAQAFNALNHAQYLPGTIDNVNGPSYTASYNFQTVTSAAFNHPEKIFGNNPRTMQLTAKFSF